MSDPSLSPQQRDFHCQHCNGRIVIPISLPSTTGPCPHCQGTITSPPPEEGPPVQAAPPSAYSAPPQGYAPPQAPQAPAPVPAQAPQAPPVQQEPIQQPSRPAALPPRRDGAETPAPNTTIPAPARAIKSKKSSGIIPAMIGLFLLILAGGAAVYYIASQMGSAIESPNFAGSPEDKEIREANYIR
ncbi:MAG: hypothetical protein NWQ16_09795, partial [Akkermansiaceae bacterium]|nr:hypothetical protein [Akkermansiaceae bacterium]